MLTKHENIFKKCCVIDNVSFLETKVEKKIFKFLSPWITKSLTRYLKQQQNSNEKLFKKRNSKMYKSYKNLFETLTIAYSLQLKIRNKLTSYI